MTIEEYLAKFSLVYHLELKNKLNSEIDFGLALRRMLTDAYKEGEHF